MKKLISLLAVAALCLSLIPAAYGMDLSGGWSDSQKNIDALNLEGQFVTVGSLSLKVWLPSEWKPYTLPQSVVEERGYLGYYMNADQTAALGITLTIFENTEITLAEVADALRETETDAISEVRVNDLPCLSYSYELDDNLICHVLTVLAGGGYVAEFAFIGGDPAVSKIIAGSVQAAE